jgi:type IV pilus assembly protein PilB
MKAAKRLGEVLIERKIIATSQLEHALQKSRELSIPLGEALIRLRYVSENLMLEAIAGHIGVDFVNIAENNFQVVDKSLYRVLPLEFCKQQKVLPLFQIIDDQVRELTLAMADPLSEDAIREAEVITECRINPVLASQAAIEEGISKMYQIKLDVKAVPLSVEKGDSVGIVNRILQRAVSLGASDIHIEPHEKNVCVRMRIDGVLELATSYPTESHSAIVSRIKVKASEKNALMRIDEKRLPQDGSFSAKIDGHSIDCRVSTLPMIFGEKVVMRIFDKDRATFIGRIRDLKMSPRMELIYRRCVRRPNGINLVTGPTGSGKTTSLNAVINEINNVGLNIVTVEDPVEYLAGGHVNQSSLMPQAGYTYARALRALMRQDPDVILIGEVRDLDTAQIAVQASLTGHRVFTTLHTEDAAGSIARLVDMGVEHFLLSATLVSAVNQRLIRKICSNCMEEYVPTRVEMLDTGLDKEIIDEIQKTPRKYSMRRGRGCSMCRQSGYSGRQAVYELISMSAAMRELIMQKQGAEAMVRVAREKENINMLFEEGLRLFISGATTLGELQLLPRGDYRMKSLADIFKDAQVK